MHNDPGDENDFKGRLDYTSIMGHPGLSQSINDQIAQSAIYGGAKLADLAVGRALKVTTLNSIYTLRRMAFATYRIEGGDVLPGPVLGHVHGSTWGGSMIKLAFVGRGMHLEFSYDHPTRKRVTVTTSPITDIEEIQ